MLKYKIKKIDDKLIYWDVKYYWKINPTVKDYLNEIQATATEEGDRRMVWIYSNGLNVGYANFYKDKARFYCNGNLNVWNAIVLKCECIADSSSHLYRIWIRDNEEYAYAPVRPVVPSMLLMANH
jgi:hypothetical protein